MSLPTKRFRCGNCGQIVEVSQGVPKPSDCPRCGASSIMIHRTTEVRPGEEEVEGLRGNGLDQKISLF